MMNRLVPAIDQKPIKFARSGFKRTPPRIDAALQRLQITRTQDEKIARDTRRAVQKVNDLIDKSMRENTIKSLLMTKEEAKQHGIIESAQGHILCSRMSFYSIQVNLNAGLLQSSRLS